MTIRKTCPSSPTWVQAYLDELVNKERASNRATGTGTGEHRRLRSFLRRKRAAAATRITRREPALILQFHRRCSNACRWKGCRQVSLRRPARTGPGQARQDDEAPEAELGLLQQLAQDPVHQRLLARRAPLEEEATQIRAVAAPAVSDKLLKDVDQQLAAIDREMKARRDALRPAFLSQKREKLESRSTILQEEMKEVTAQLERQDAEALLPMLSGSRTVDDRVKAPATRWRRRAGAEEGRRAAHGRRAEPMLLPEPAGRRRATAATSRDAKMQPARALALLGICGNTARGAHHGRSVAAGVQR